MRRGSSAGCHHSESSTHEYGADHFLLCLSLSHQDDCVNRRLFIVKLTPWWLIRTTAVNIHAICYLIPYVNHTGVLRTPCCTGFHLSTSNQQNGAQSRLYHQFHAFLHHLAVFHAFRARQRPVLPPALAQRIPSSLTGACGSPP